MGNTKTASKTTTKVVLGLKLKYLFTNQESILSSNGFGIYKFLQRICDEVYTQIENFDDVMYDPLTDRVDR